MNIEDGDLLRVRNSTVILELQHFFGGIYSNGSYNLHIMMRHA